MTIQATVRAVARTASRLPRKSVITLTPRAVSRLQSLESQGSEHKFLRIAVKQKGCSGNEYMFEYAKEKAKNDEEVKQDGVTVLIEPKALLSIIGSEMDYVEDKLSEQFVFNNPNVKGTCGCGKSFMV